MPLPDYDFLPAPLWLLTILHLLTLTLHFVAMNFMLGGVAVVLFGKIDDKWSHPVVGKFTTLFPSIMAATITLGVAPLLFLQLVYPKQVYAAAITSAWFWMMIVGAAMIAYFLFYGTAFRKENERAAKPLYLGIALIALVYISVIYSSVFAMSEDPGLIASLYAADQSGFAFNTAIGSWIFRWLHMLFGALTVAGFFVGVLGKDDDRIFGLGKTVLLYGAAFASLFGLIWLFTLGDALSGLMRSAGVWYLTIAIVAAAVSLALFFRRRFLYSAVLLFVSMFGMVATRHELRLVQLGDALAVPVVRPQWDVFTIFLVCFIAAIGIVAWMLRALLRPAVTEA